MLIVLICLPWPWKMSFFFYCNRDAIETKAALLEEAREVGVRAEGGGAVRYAEMESRFNINSSTMEPAQPSSSKVTKSQWGKVISKYQVYLQVFVLQKKKSLSYLLSVFPFPFGRMHCNEKRNEGRLFLTECFVNTVDFTGRADSCSSWRGEQKMSLINQKQNDQWPVSAAMRSPGCEQHSTAY